jgi:hypothetical protein
MATTALIANVASTLVMVGVIWFVQHVHYPLLATFGVKSAASVAVDHQRRTGHVVAVPMAVEGLSTLVLLVSRPDGVMWLWPWVGAALLAVALGSTVLLSVPLHARMAADPQVDTGRRLVTTNWPRTVAWSLRGIVCIVMTAQALGGGM